MGYEAWCVEVKCKRRRRILVQLRGGTAVLEVEIGRWRGVRGEEKVRRNCKSEEVENVAHWLLRCTGMAEEREKLIMTMREKVEWQNMENDDRSLTVPVPPMYSQMYYCLDQNLIYVSVTTD